MLAPARLHRPSPARPAATTPNAAAPVRRPASAVPANAAAAHSFARVSVHPAPVSLQAKLTVGGTGDPHEREAEQVAERVMREAAPAPHRCSCGGTCPACCAAAKRREELSRAADRGAAAPATAPPLVHEVLRAPGRPLDSAAAAFLEPRFGHDFGRVRVHADGRAAESARAVGARAYTVGSHVVFGAGEYQPSTEGGRRLLAHELAHVLQQDASSSVLRRAPNPTPPAGGTTPPTPPAGTSTLERKMKGDACACLVFVHNEERNARLTAELMQKHCSYNLAIISPDVAGRRLVPVKGAGTLDPNSFFDPKVIAECRANPQGCRDFVRDKAATPNLEWTRKQFFMAIHDCSKEFTLPVVALHNNSISDTAELRKELKAKEKKDAAAAAKALKEGKPAPAATDPFEGVPRDLDKPVDPPKGKPVPVVEAMKKALRDRFGEKAQKALTDTPRITNIFRWCAASELSRCHAGDPENPDNVVWVTNKADFDTLSRQKVNVVLQTSVGKESVGDLSSMFLEIEKQIGQEAVALLTPLWNEVDWGDVLAPEFGEKLARIDRIVDESQKKIESLHFVNVETPAKQSDSSTPMWLHVVEQYRAIVATLKPLNLHCCKQDPALLTSPEENVKMGIKAALQPPEPKKKKKPAAKK